ncbi:type II toxin-antitoxin system RatA family toxin [Wolbachia endosymbiont of Atemnus politus]|uniref:type II toxin-antitoxin system RatA family toxin n=1 Tax=Wolbachia endosymbiont of Atemnus politus TaxID=2682840 RepID=UPI001572DBFE|nr:type II toxin-antitoxin system RatA family toxin [Wolbachia endosymbiont of Atemnus politus]NSM56204.1 type II toxin-antitoxin system RatA family toxin [Wolbachia endosymbiont of Atemnus politus]NSX83372.1 type II toxin-antitoxin system RatA family toxin [Wolbachia endosymbiont of Atemnus politus]
MLHQYEEQDTFFCSPNEIFQVVIDVEKYPDFVPWCKAVYIKEKIDNQMVVDLLAAFHGIKGRYTSEVTFLFPNETNESWIKAVSSNGIFKHLYNEWKFIPIDENKTMVKFYIEFEFKSSSLSTLLNSVYKYTQSKIIAAFKDRVESLAEKKLS